MRTCYVLQSQSSPDLRGFTDTPEGNRLPAEEGPWTLVRTIQPEEPWDIDIHRSIVLAGLLENGFYLSGPWNRPASSKPKPIIASDRVEGTAVFDSNGSQIGTIKRLLIEKVSGRVLSVDVTFGGFLGVGVHHRTIPWDELTYDTHLAGYRTDITEEEVRNAPAFGPDYRTSPEQRDNWEEPLRGPI
jgi:hypothetical protein